MILLFFYIDCVWGTNHCVTVFGKVNFSHCYHVWTCLLKKQNKSVTGCFQLVLVTNISCNYLTCRPVSLKMFSAAARHIVLTSHLFPVTVIRPAWLEPLVCKLYVSIALWLMKDRLFLSRLMLIWIFRPASVFLSPHRLLCLPLSICADAWLSSVTVMTPLESACQKQDPLLCSVHKLTFMLCAWIIQKSGRVVILLLCLILSGFFFVVFFVFYLSRNIHFHSILLFLFGNKHYWTLKNTSWSPDHRWIHSCYGFIFVVAF